MKKAVLIPDSFKGTLSSLRICELMRSCIAELCPGCEVVSIPVADGGEGSVEAFLEAVGGRRVEAQVTGPWFEPCTAHYGLLDDGQVAVLEMAAAAGLPMVGERRDPSRTTTFGLGELLLHAADNGARRIILGLGGSATNDGGCGAAAAAGLRFLNSDGACFVPVGGTLKDIAAITTPDSSTIRVQPWDKNILKDVEKAILVANIGFTPAVMGDAVRCPIPALSGERRAELAKICHEMAEQGRVRVRNIRREAIDAFKKLQKSGGATEDDVKKFEKEVQNLTDKSIADINTQLSRKEEDLKKI